MDEAGHLEEWKKLLSDLERVGGKVERVTVIQLTKLFKHLKPHVAPRLQREYESCTLKSEKLLENLFDLIYLSDHPLLCSYLRLLRSFGYYRLAQITYHIESLCDLALDDDPIYSPPIDKMKWYELTPILPKAGQIGWKGIMNHCLVKEEHQLLQECLKLLTQKLHFLAVAMSIDRYKSTEGNIRKNGQRVAEKLFELIRDTSLDDESMIGLDPTLFNLLGPFADDEQQAAIIEATVQDLFKPHLLQQETDESNIDRLYNLIDECFMDRAQNQDMFVIKLIQHLKTHIIRRKRRRSIEESESDTVTTLEAILDAICGGEQPCTLLSKNANVNLAAKTFQLSYFSYWLLVLERSIHLKTLTAVSAIRLLSVCSSILINSSELRNDDLIENLSRVMTKVIENTAQSRLDRLFKRFDHKYLSLFTSMIDQRTKALTLYNSPLQKFFRAYNNRYLKWCVMRTSKSDAEKFHRFVINVCEGGIGKTASRILPYTCLESIVECFQNFKAKISNKVMDIFVTCAKMCTTCLLPFIRRHVTFETHGKSSNDVDMSHQDSDSSISNGSNRLKEQLATDALICLFKIHTSRSTIGILEEFGMLLIGIYEMFLIRLDLMVKNLRAGCRTQRCVLDPHLCLIFQLFSDHKDSIAIANNIELNQKVVSILTYQESGNSGQQLNGKNGKQTADKKLIYNELKSALEAMTERSEKSANVYQTIINKQYTAVVDQALVSVTDIDREKVCCDELIPDMNIIGNIGSTVLQKCTFSDFAQFVKSVIGHIEKCDPLDHHDVLYSMLMLECAINNLESRQNNPQVFDLLKGNLGALSSSLIKIAKTVELGPSHRSFTNSGSHTSNKSIQCCTYSNCIKLYSLLLQNFTPKMNLILITDAMQICVSANLDQYAKSTRLYRYFLQLSTAMAGLLKSIGIGRRDGDMIVSTLPIFLANLSNLMGSLIIASDRQRFDRHTDVNELTNGHHDDRNIDTMQCSEIIESELELLALDIARTLNNMSFLRVSLVDFAPVIISTYVKNIQKASCSDMIRVHLNEGIYRIFNLIDAHENQRRENIIEGGVQRKTNAGRAKGSMFEMIHSRLDQASREIFKDLHDDYNKFHRYLGKC